MWESSPFLGALTPKFYVALTGTSSLISGLILIFEWWYFRKYGTSFIEQLSMSSVWAWAGGQRGEPGEWQVWRNPAALLRGAEYARLPPGAPTHYDMNLSAQDHQAWFGADELLARAWREREPAARVAAARAALRLRPDCAPALLLLAEEDAPTVLEAERVLRRAWRAAEADLRAAAGSPAARAQAAVLAHVKRRAGVCARRLGRLKEAARVFRELAREGGGHENLLEVLLEQRQYADAAAVLARCGEASACTLYSAALLRARAAPDAAALHAIRLAVDFNPYVPALLLELRALSPPPEHVVRRGRSEALAYAFWHLRHWRRAEPALRLLAAAVRPGEAGGRAPPLAGGARAADRSLVGARRAGAGAGGALAGAAALLCALTTLTLAPRWAGLALDPRSLLSAL